MKSSFPRILHLLLVAFFSVGVRASGQIASEQPASSAACSTAGDAAILEQRTVNLVRAEVYRAAECEARALVQLVPQSPDGHYLLGYILNREDQPALSLAEYTAGARYRTPGGSDFAIVALDYVLLHDNADAARWMKQALITESSNELYWYYLGRIEYNLNDFPEAISAFEKASSLRPDDLRPIYNLGLTYEGNGDMVHAGALYRKAIAEEQKSGIKDAQPYFDLGSLLLKQNDTIDALPALQQARKLDSRNAAIDEAVAKAEEQNGQLLAARRDYEQAVALVPNISALHFELGRVDQKLHDTQAAKLQFSLCTAELGTHSSSGLNLDFNREP